MSVEDVIFDLMNVLATGSDAELNHALAKLDQLRRRTAGTDRERVIEAIGECRDLMSPAGRLQRALNLAVRQGREIRPEVDGQENAA
jgi:hypothetical protein